MFNADEARRMVEIYKAGLLKQQSGAIQYLESKIMPTIEECAKSGKTHACILLPAEISAIQVMEQLIELEYAVRIERQELIINW